MYLRSFLEFFCNIMFLKLDLDECFSTALPVNFLACPPHFNSKDLIFSARSLRLHKIRFKTTNLLKIVGKLGHLFRLKKRLDQRRLNLFETGGVHTTTKNLDGIK